MEDKYFPTLLIATFYITIIWYFLLWQVLGKIYKLEYGNNDTK